MMTTEIQTVLDGITELTHYHLERGKRFSDPQNIRDEELMVARLDAAADLICALDGKLTKARKEIATIAAQEGK